MKVLKYILVLGSLISICSCSDSFTPSAIAKAYTKALMSYNFEEAGTYVTGNVYPTYESMNLEIQKADEKTVSMVRTVVKDAKFEVTQEKVNDNSAEITIKVEQKGSNFLDRHIHLIKEDNKWKVNQAAEFLNYEITFIKKGGLRLNEINK